MVNPLPAAIISAVSRARSNGLLMTVLIGIRAKASARRAACSLPASFNATPGKWPGSKCSIFHVVCPCRIKSRVCFILFCVLSVICNCWSQRCTRQRQKRQPTCRCIHNIYIQLYPALKSFFRQPLMNINRVSYLSLIRPALHMSLSFSRYIRERQADQCAFYCIRGGVSGANILVQRLSILPGECGEKFMRPAPVKCANADGADCGSHILDA